MKSPEKRAVSSNAAVKNYKEVPSSVNPTLVKSPEKKIKGSDKPKGDSNKDSNNNGKKKKEKQEKEPAPPLPP